MGLADGGTPQLAKKSKDGKRPGYQGNPFGYEDAPQSTKVERTAASEDIGFDQPSAPTTETKTTTTTGDGLYQDRILSMVDKTKIPGTEEYKKAEEENFKGEPKSLLSKAFE